MDFKNLNSVWKLKGKFCFQFESLFNFDFLMHKINLRSLFSRFCLSENIDRPFISKMAKFEVHNFFSF